MMLCQPEFSKFTDAIKILKCDRYLFCSMDYCCMQLTRRPYPLGLSLSYLYTSHQLFLMFCELFFSIFWKLDYINCNSTYLTCTLNWSISFMRWGIRIWKYFYLYNCFKVSFKLVATVLYQWPFPGSNSSLKPNNDIFWALTIFKYTVTSLWFLWRASRLSNHCHIIST